ILLKLKVLAGAVFGLERGLIHGRWEYLTKAVCRRAEKQRALCVMRGSPFDKLRKLTVREMSGLQSQSETLQDKAPCNPHPPSW
ncbi:hypothetical protein, partial [Phyllobacterium sp.]|uniref:hypothetical protein n=1 Tax=Phyllobacterium sp. TaxID=1871046 RepID=UPI0031FD090C|nr:hypothetical protein [Phyllobacterium sp.]